MADDTDAKPSLWQRFVAWLRRVFRRPIPPGRFETGRSKLVWRGMLRLAPFVSPRREYLLYVHAGYSRWRASPLLVLIHGCKQTPEDIAQGTRITELADRDQFLVLMPRQKKSANLWRCWNWFDTRTMAGDGEAAIVAAQVRQVQNSFSVDPQRIHVAGISSGGILTATLALTHPDIVKAAVVHSGGACGAASSALTAMKAMEEGTTADVLRIADGARKAAGREGVLVPLLAIHGEDDQTVASANANALVRQFLRFNDHPAVRDASGPVTELPPADETRRETSDPARTITTYDWRREGRLVVRYVSVAGLGHAWSGGNDALPYNDPRAPSALELWRRFASDVKA
jgi:poly(hydroxyalkanoate) depolymerase family esterase